MPFPVGSVAQHDDSQHIASAKRDTANGVAGLSGAGNILAVGPKISLVRDGSALMYMGELTSSETWLQAQRIAANDYDMFVKESAVFKQVQTESMKNIANGIAGLDASSKFAGLLSTDNVPVRRAFPAPASNTWTDEGNIDDENTATYMSCSGSADVAYDLGASKHVGLGLWCLFNPGDASSPCSISIYGSPDNTNWYLMDTYSAQYTAGGYKIALSGIGFFRYLKISAVKAGVGTFYTYVYEASLIY